MRNLKIFGIIVFLAVIGSLATVVASDNCPVTEEVQWTVSLRVSLTGGSTSGTVTVWAINGSQAEERGKQKWLDENPRLRDQVLSISANATRR